MSLSQDSRSMCSACKSRYKSLISLSWKVQTLRFLESFLISLRLKRRLQTRALINSSCRADSCSFLASFKLRFSITDWQLLWLSNRLFRQSFSSRLLSLPIASNSHSIILKTEFQMNSRMSAFSLHSFYSSQRYSPMKLASTSCFHTTTSAALTSFLADCMADRVFAIFYFMRRQFERCWLIFLMLGPRLESRRLPSWKGVDLLRPSWVDLAVAMRKKASGEVTIWNLLILECPSTFSIKMLVLSSSILSIFSVSIILCHPAVQIFQYLYHLCSFFIYYQLSFMLPLFFPSRLDFFIPSRLDILFPHAQISSSLTLRYLLSLTLRFLLPSRLDIFFPSRLDIFFPSRLNFFQVGSKAKINANLPNPTKSQVLVQFGLYPTLPHKLRFNISKFYQQIWFLITFIRFQSVLAPVLFERESLSLFSHLIIRYPPFLSLALAQQSLHRRKGLLQRKFAQKASFTFFKTVQQHLRSESAPFWPRRFGGHASIASQNHSKQVKCYLCSIEILIFSVCKTSSIESFETIAFFLQNLGAVIDHISIFVELEISLRNVKSQNIQKLFSFTRMLIFQEIDAFLVVSNCTLVVRGLQFLVSAQLQPCSLRHLLLVTVLPFLLLLVFEIKQLNFEVEGGVRGDFRGRTFSAIGVLWRTDECGLLALSHSCESFVPAFDYPAFAEHKVERGLPTLAGIEESSILQGSLVSGKDFLPFLGLFSLALLVHYFGEFSLDNYHLFALHCYKSNYNGPIYLCYYILENYSRTYKTITGSSYHVKKHFLSYKAQAEMGKHLNGFCKALLLSISIFGLNPVCLPSSRIVAAVKQ